MKYFPENWLKAKTQILRKYFIDIKLDERILTRRRQKKDFRNQPGWIPPFPSSKEL
jgi:hypothetical protein